MPGDSVVPSAKQEGPETDIVEDDSAPKALMFEDLVVGQQYDILDSTNRWCEGEVQYTPLCCSFIASHVDFFDAIVEN